MVFIHKYIFVWVFWEIPGILESSQVFLVFFLESSQVFYTFLVFFFSVLMLFSRFS